MKREHLIKKGILIAFLFLSFQLFSQRQNSLIKNGIWQASVLRNDSNNIQFNFIAATKNGKSQITILNAEEKLSVDDIQQYKDSIVISLPFFSTSLRVKQITDKELKGVYIKGSGERKQEIPFTAYWGVKERYKQYAKARQSLAGTWDVEFKGKRSTVKAVGNFEQTAEGILKGSFLTPTGDYRFLEGIVSGDTLKLSGFDGGFASYFTGIIKNDTTIADAHFYSGAVAEETWTAVKNDHAKLPDEFGYSHLRSSGISTLSFSFKNTDGKVVSVKDEKYKGKVVVVQILGSWCPNCMDETAFLSAYYNENKNRGVEMIGLAYERNENFNESKKALEPFRKRFNVQYPFLITGVTPSDPQRVEKTLPEIDRISAFPTTIFLDKKGNVRKIHTGFDGPGTGKFYTAFVKEFNELISELLAEE